MPTPPSTRDKIIADAKDVPSLLAAAQTDDPALFNTLTGTRVKNVWIAPVASVVAAAAAHFGLGWDAGTCSEVAGMALFVVTGLVHWLTLLAAAPAAASPLTLPKSLLALLLLAPLALGLSACGTAPAAPAPAATAAAAPAVSPTPASLVNTLQAFTAADLTNAVSLATKAEPTNPYAVEIVTCLTWWQTVPAALTGVLTPPAGTVGAATLFTEGMLGLDSLTGLTGAGTQAQYEIACGPLNTHIVNQGVALAAQLAAMAGRLGIKVAVPALAPLS